MIYKQDSPPEIKAIADNGVRASRDTHDNGARKEILLEHLRQIETSISRREINQQELAKMADNLEKDPQGKVLSEEYDFIDIGGVRLEIKKYNEKL